MFNFTTKDEYLEQRAAWTSEYKALTAKIRELKSGRKEFKWEYREAGNNTSKRKTKVGPNPHYNPSQPWVLDSLRNTAHNMMNDLAAAKVEAAKQYSYNESAVV